MAANATTGSDLHPMTEELAAGRNFAAVSTVVPSGQVQAQMIWVGLQGGKLVLNTETYRAKHRNIEQDRRITVLIRDEQDPYRYAELRGRVSDTATGSLAREQLDELARKYTGGPYPAEAIKSERVIWWITPERQTVVARQPGRHHQ